MRPSLLPALGGLMSSGVSPQSGRLRRPDCDIYGRSRSEAPPAPPPGCAPSAPTLGAAQLHGRHVAELQSALAQEHARVCEQRDGLAKQRRLLLRCLVAWFVHRFTDPRTAPLDDLD